MEEIGPALLLAVAGYITLRHCANRTKFRWAALDWEQNVFESAAVGVFLFVVVRTAWVITPQIASWPFVGVLMKPLWAWALATSRAIHEALPFQFSASLVATFVLGIGGGYLSNLWWRAESEVRRAVRNHGGDLRIFLHDAAEAGWPVSLTMRNRKVYVGLVLVPPGLEEPSYVTLLPTLSGYRDEHTLKLVFTTPYEHVYEDLRKRRSASEPVTLDVISFSFVLPLENVDSANRYDNDAYARYFAGDPTSVATVVTTAHAPPAVPPAAPPQDPRDGGSGPSQGGAGDTSIG